MILTGVFFGSCAESEFGFPVKSAMIVRHEGKRRKSSLTHCSAGIPQITSDKRPMLGRLWRPASFDGRTAVRSRRIRPGDFRVRILTKNCTPAFYNLPKSRSG